jgi:hypothetical protein
MNADEALADIAAIDRVLVHVLAFTGEIEAASRDFKRVAVFKRGELQRAVCDVLRAAKGPMTARQIAESAWRTKGHELKPGKLSKQRINEVRKVCERMFGPATERGASGAVAWTG